MAQLPGEAPAPYLSWTARVAVLLALGLGLRLYHYLRNPSMWHDEAAVVLNVLDKNYPEMLGPLRFSEAAPLLFLWAEKAASELGGDSTLVLRLIPFLAGVAALLLMLLAARRVLSPAAILWLLLLFGCSDRLLWHGCEAKPYAIDVAVAVGLLLAVIHTSAWPLGRRLLLFAALSPGLVFLSYPTCFLLGGLALSQLPDVIRSHRVRSWLLFGLFLLAAGGSFLLLLKGPVRAQRDETILRCWWDMFPDWGRPWMVPGWEVLRLVEVFRYALEPVGHVLVPVAGIGAVVLWQAGRRKVLALLLGPLALACLASLLRQYPMGATRVMVFAAPATLLLTAAGLPPTLAWLHRRGAPCPMVLVGVVLFPVGQAVFRVVSPWPRFDSAGASAFVRSRCQPGELVVGTDWEQEYYFRDRRGDFLFLKGRKKFPADRLWLIAVGKSEESRGYLRKVQASGPWVVRDVREFQRTIVFHLERKEDKTRGEQAGALTPVACQPSAPPDP